MASFSDDSVKAKLSTLNETQDAIVSVAQWLLFHKRHAVRTAELWMAKLNDSSPTRRLSLIYLANEVVQQSKARKKEDFAIAFSPIVAEGTAIAYKNSPLDIQGKIRRVVEVWRQRAIFEEKTQVEVEAKLDELDRIRATTRGGRGGGSIFGSSEPSIPTIFQPILAANNALTKAESKAKTIVATLQSNHDDVRNNTSTVLPIKAAQLGALLQTLSEAESSVAESLHARQNLLASLEKLVSTTKSAITADEEQARNLQVQRKSLEDEKRNVEDRIVRGISNGDESAYEPPRPDAEPLTPPPVESLTPVGSPQPAEDFVPAPADPRLANGAKHGHESNGAEDQPASKKRRVQVSHEFAGFQDDDGGIDPDVAAMLAED
ncbi:DUF618-domain-containing protein [Microthyrium microscopicum]|uniref:DUF618-domain-containing protein n=1 Tax=Microthyrium microscopicum TaxID=703497 RepID=A0A6A6UP55_9PEZI|nr:DUF618-domain-containing protein [Microthyrium microscopicum]